MRQRNKVEAESEHMTELRKVVSPSRELEAAFAPQLAMVGCSLAHRARELLVMRQAASTAYAGGSTMGIPLLYPWANRLATGIHGVAGLTWSPIRQRGPESPTATARRSTA